MDLHATSLSALIRGDPEVDANELLEKFKQYIDESEKVRRDLWMSEKCDIEHGCHCVFPDSFPRHCAGG